MTMQTSATTWIVLY